MKTAAAILVFGSLGLMLGGAVTIGVLALGSAIALFCLAETFDG